ncbi:MAG: Mitochondrial import inner membrane translocase subunit tim8 [Sclerophora amabilis]|nr:MAG: Mitochondrial import inner membrane translocase subunit tim8 [Sclerophora amabilis]
MDATSSIGPNNLDLSKLSQNDKTELQQFIVNESKKAQLQQSIHSLTETCFAKCVTSKISSGKLDKSEETCAQNCVDRFMDANMQVLKHLQDMRGAM